VGTKIAGRRFKTVKKGSDGKGAPSFNDGPQAGNILFHARLHRNAQTSPARLKKVKNETGNLATNKGGGKLFRKVSVGEQVEEHLTLKKNSMGAANGRQNRVECGKINTKGKNKGGYSILVRSKQSEGEQTLADIAGGAK